MNKKTHNQYAHAAAHPFNHMLSISVISSERSQLLSLAAQPFPIADLALRGRHSGGLHYDRDVQTRQGWDTCMWLLIAHPDLNARMVAVMALTNHAEDDLARKTLQASSNGHCTSLRSRAEMVKWMLPIGTFLQRRDVSNVSVAGTFPMDGYLSMHLQKMYMNS
jgi:hypothetical protein